MKGKARFQDSRWESRATAADWQPYLDRIAEHRPGADLRIEALERLLLLTATYGYGGPGPGADNATREAHRERWALHNCVAEMLTATPSPPSPAGPSHCDYCGLNPPIGEDDSGRPYCGDCVCFAWFSPKEKG